MTLTTDNGRMGTAVDSAHSALRAALARLSASPYRLAGQQGLELSIFSQRAERG